MGIVRVSGKFVCHGSVIMAGWRCPQGDASSRWLIVIRTDLFLPTPTMIAVQIRMCAARAIRWRNWRSWSGRPIRSAPRPSPPFRCSRGPMSARNTPPPRKKRARPLGRRHEEEPEPRTRSGGMVTVAAVLALAVVGTRAAFAYRTYVGCPR